MGHGNGVLGVGLAGVGVWLLGGCLFPSFDDYQAVEAPVTADGGKTTSADGATTPPSTLAPPDTDAAVTPSPISMDGAPDAAPAGPSIACGGAQCRGGEVCCVGMTGDESCRPSGAGSCSAILRCDDSTDCGGGICCLSFGTASCGSSCFGQILCDPNSPRCPSDQPRCAYPAPGGRTACGW